jgi:hypothetical protein
MSTFKIDFHKLLNKKIYLSSGGETDSVLKTNAKVGPYVVFVYDGEKSKMAQINLEKNLNEGEYFFRMNRGGYCKYCNREQFISLHNFGKRTRMGKPFCLNKACSNIIAETPDSFENHINEYKVKFLVGDQGVLFRKLQEFMRKHEGLFKLEDLENSPIRHFASEKDKKILLEDFNNFIKGFRTYKISPNEKEVKTVKPGSDKISFLNPAKKSLEQGWEDEVKNFKFDNTKEIENPDDEPTDDDLESPLT